MSPTTYTISELSKEFVITTRSIRFYEDQGLLSPKREGQKRIYSNHDRTWLKLILRGKRLGLTLAEISQILDLYDSSSTNNDQQLIVFIEKIKTRKEGKKDLYEVEIINKSGEIRYWLTCAALTPFLALNLWRLKHDKHLHQPQF